MKVKNDLENKRCIPIIVWILAPILLFAVAIVVGVAIAAIRSGGLGANTPYSSESMEAVNEFESAGSVNTDVNVQETIPNIEESQESTPTQVEQSDVVAGHLFKEVKETVTAKDVTNLRDIPSQDTDSHVMAALQNGQTAERVAVSDSGWSRVIYNGETYYAVSSLLTTDLSVKTEPVQEPNDGITTEFKACDEMVSPKIEVNLRTMPSVTDPNSQVVVLAKYGEVFRRTGINEEYGWSRVEYNGQTLYCVSSYIYVYEVPAE